MLSGGGAAWKLGISATSEVGGGVARGVSMSNWVSEVTVEAWEAREPGLRERGGGTGDSPSVSIESPPAAVLPEKD